MQRVDCCAAYNVRTHATCALSVHGCAHHRHFRALVFNNFSIFHKVKKYCFELRKLVFVVAKEVCVCYSFTMTKQAGIK